MSENTTKRVIRIALALCIINTFVLASEAANAAQSAVTTPSMKRLIAKENRLQQQIAAQMKLLNQESHASVHLARAHRASTPLKVTKPHPPSVHRVVYQGRHAHKLQNTWVSAIRVEVAKYWSRIKGLKSGQSCQVSVKQNRQGYVRSIQFGHCTGDARFIQAVLSVINQAQPFPRAPSQQVFQSILNFSFKPLAP